MKQNRSGFTLIELVVVIMIIGILAAYALPRLSDATRSAGDATVMVAASSFRTGVAILKTKHVTKYKNADKIDASDGNTYTIAFGGGGIPISISLDGVGTTEPLFAGSAASDQGCLYLFNALLEMNTQDGVSQLVGTSSSCNAALHHYCAKGQAKEVGNFKLTGCYYEHQGSHHTGYDGFSFYIKSLQDNVADAKNKDAFFVITGDFPDQIIGSGGVAAKEAEVTP